MSDMYEIFVFCANSHTAIIKRSNVQQGSKRVSCSRSPHFLSQNCSTATKQGQKYCLSLLKSNIQHVLMMGQSCRFFTQWSIPPAECWMWTSGMDGEPSFWLNKIMQLWLHCFVFQVKFDPGGFVWLTYRLYWWKVIGPEKEEWNPDWSCKRGKYHIFVHILKNKWFHPKTCESSWGARGMIKNGYSIRFKELYPFGTSFVQSIKSINILEKWIFTVGRQAPT